MVFYRRNCPGLAPGASEQKAWLFDAVCHRHATNKLGTLPRRDLGPHREVNAVDAERDLGQEAASRTARNLFRSPRYRAETPTGRFFASNCARRMMKGTDHPRRFARTGGACRLDVDHLLPVRRERRVVQGIHDVLPQPGDRPAPELPVDR